MSDKTEGTGPGAPIDHKHAGRRADQQPENPFSIIKKGWTSSLTVQALASDDNNKIYAAGWVGASPRYQYYLVRLKPESSQAGAVYDESFNGDGFVLIGEFDIGDPGNEAVVTGVSQIHVHAERVTLYTEVLTQSGRIQEAALIRYTLDGVRDESFGVSGMATFSDLPGGQPDPDPVVGIPGPGGLKPIVPTAGQIDTQASLAPASASGWLRDGSMLIVAYKRSTRRTSYLIKVNPDGIRDLAFNAGVGYTGLTFTGNDNASAWYSLSTDSSGFSIVAGQGQDGTALVSRYDVSGAVDTEFGDKGLVTYNLSPGTYTSPFVSVVDDRLYVAICTKISNVLMVLLYKLDMKGALDPSFNNGEPIKFSSTGQNIFSDLDSIGVDQGQRIYMRAVRFAPSKDETLLARFTRDGLDTGFGESGVKHLIGRGLYSNGLAVRPDSDVLFNDNTYVFRIEVND